MDEGKTANIAFMQLYLFLAQLCANTCAGKGVKIWLQHFIIQPSGFMKRPGQDYIDHETGQKPIVEEHGGSVCGEEQGSNIGKLTGIRTAYYYDMARQERTGASSQRNTENHEQRKTQ